MSVNYPSWTSVDAAAKMHERATRNISVLQHSTADHAANGTESNVSRKTMYPLDSSSVPLCDVAHRYPSSARRPTALGAA